ncbi:MAG: hypothetical protein HC875_14385 [Anaerolineales bacterium]|nr:hypothetical protein [Anaerolineales bacterium]
MPTRRAWTLFILSAILYFLANQTQVGWIYIITDGIIGLLIVAALYSWGMLTGIRASRELRPVTVDSAEPASQTDEFELTLPAFHEDDPIEISLHFQHTGLRPALLVGGLEQCPFAPVEDVVQPFFVSTLFRGQTNSLIYRTVCDRRGLYSFGPLRLESKGPFGLFRTRSAVAARGEILIYPAYHPLKRLRLFEKREFAEQSSLRVAGAAR